MFPIITPVYIPRHDPEEDKVECPKCHHRFLLPEDSCNDYCKLPLLFSCGVLFVSLLIGVLSILGLITPDNWFNTQDTMGYFANGHRDAFEVFFGINCLCFLLSLPIGLLIHFFETKE